MLVNNAGVFPYGPLEDVTADELHRTLAVHVGSAFRASQAAARHMGAGAFTALGRYGTPDEAAATVAHLAGPGGRWVTGAAFAVDGGYAA